MTAQIPRAHPAPRAPSQRWGSWRVWPALIDAVAILVVGSLPSAPPGTERFSDKTLHAIAFGIFAWLAARAIRFLRPELPISRLLFGGFAVSTGLGAALELWQALLPYRSSEFLDLVADAVGAAIAVLLTGAGWQVARRGAPSA